jgi:hypothetical protein
VSRSPLLLGAGSERERATRIGIARICVGGSMLLTPGLARRFFGIPGEQDKGGALRLVSRLFGIRNVVLGGLALRSRDLAVDERRLLYRINAGIDAADLVALGWAGLRGDGLARPALMGGGLGASALLAWLDLLGDVRGG